MTEEEEAEEEEFWMLGVKKTRNITQPLACVTACVCVLYGRTHQHQLRGSGRGGTLDAWP